MKVLADRKENSSRLVVVVVVVVISSERRSKRSRTMETWTSYPTTPRQKANVTDIQGAAKSAPLNFSRQSLGMSMQTFNDSFSYPIYAHNSLISIQAELAGSVSTKH